MKLNKFLLYFTVLAGLTVLTNLTTGEMTSYYNFSEDDARIEVRYNVNTNGPSFQIQRNTNSTRNNNRNNARSESSSGVYQGDVIYPAIPQEPDHSNEIPLYPQLDWDAYYQGLLQ